MVLKRTPKGNLCREPPYTREKEAEFYRRVSDGPVTVVKPAAAPQQKPQPPAE